MKVENAAIDRLIADLSGMKHEGVKPPLNPPPKGDTSGGMDPWQQTVETRLGSLDRRAEVLSADVSTLKTDVAVIKTTMATKGWMVGALATMLGAIAALTAFADKIQAWVH